MPCLHVYLPDTTKSPRTHALTRTIKVESTGVDLQVDLLESNGMT